MKNNLKHAKGKDPSKPRPLLRKNKFQGKSCLQNQLQNCQFHNSSTKKSHLRKKTSKLFSSSQKSNLELSNKKQQLYMAQKGHSHRSSSTQRPQREKNSKKKLNKRNNFLEKWRAQSNNFDQSNNDKVVSSFRNSKNSQREPTTIGKRKVLEYWKNRNNSTETHRIRNKPQKNDLKHNSTDLEELNHSLDLRNSKKKIQNKKRENSQIPFFQRKKHSKDSLLNPKQRNDKIQEQNHLTTSYSRNQRTHRFQSKTSMIRKYRSILQNKLESRKSLDDMRMYPPSQDDNPPYKRISDYSNNNTKFNIMDDDKALYLQREGINLKNQSQRVAPQHLSIYQPFNRTQGDIYDSGRKAHDCFNDYQIQISLDSSTSQTFSDSKRPEFSREFMGSFGLLINQQDIQSSKKSTGDSNNLNKIEPLDFTKEYEDNSLTQSQYRKIQEGYDINHQNSPNNGTQSFIHQKVMEANLTSTVGEPPETLYESSNTLIREIGLPPKDIKIDEIVDMVDLSIIQNQNNGYTEDTNIRNSIGGSVDSKSPVYYNENRWGELDEEINKFQPLKNRVISGIDLLRNNDNNIPASRKSKIISNVEEGYTLAEGNDECGDETVSDKEIANSFTPTLKLGSFGNKGIFRNMDKTVRGGTSSRTEFQQNLGQIISDIRLSTKMAHERLSTEVEKEDLNSYDLSDPEGLVRQIQELELSNKEKDADIMKLTMQACQGKIETQREDKKYWLDSISK